MVSEYFIASVKSAAQRNYQIAHAARLHPSMLSKIMIGAERVKPQDPRVLRVARVLGLRSDDCFESDREQQAVDVQ